MSSDAFHAWGDESGSDQQRDPGVYIMGAVIAGEARTADLRDAMAGLRLRGERKVHWQSSSDARRDTIIGTITELEAESFVVVRVGPLDDRDERRRRKTFEALALELSTRRCGALTLESRGGKADGRDRVMLDTMRARRVLPEPMHLRHTPGPGEPVLWMADAVCGAVVAARRGEPRWLDDLVGSTSVVCLDDRART